MMNRTEKPDGIIITVAASTLKSQGGYRKWLREFIWILSQQDGVAYRHGNPKHEVLYVYICVGGQVRFRTNFVMVGESPRTGKKCILMSGPMIHAPKRAQPEMQGFQGFRYTQKLF